MLNYRIDRQQNDGSWSVQEFQSADDTGAITHGLRVRTANRCELYEADRWLATFDGVAVADNISGAHANENTRRSLIEVETQLACFHRRALEERERSRIGISAAAKLAHLKTAEHFESLARKSEAGRRRLTFYDVNASRGTNRRPLTTRRLYR